MLGHTCKLSPKEGQGRFKVAIILSAMSALEIMEDVQERHMAFKVTYYIATQPVLKVKLTSKNSVYLGMVDHTQGQMDLAQNSTRLSKKSNVNTPQIISQKQKQKEPYQIYFIRPQPP